MICKPWRRRRRKRRQPQLTRRRTYRFQNRRTRSKRCPPRRHRLGSHQPDSIWWGNLNVRSSNIIHPPPDEIRARLRDANQRSGYHQDGRFQIAFPYFLGKVTLMKSWNLIWWPPEKHPKPRNSYDFSNKHALIFHTELLIDSQIL